MNIKQLNEELLKILKEDNSNKSKYNIPFRIVFEGNINVIASDKDSAYSVAEKFIRDNDSKAIMDYSAEAYLEGTELSYEIESEDDGSIKIDYSNYKNIE